MSENSWVVRTFGRPRALIGVIHLQALPGTPLSTKLFPELLTNALVEAGLYSAAGFDGVIIENHGDAPFEKDSADPSITAMMAVLADRIIQSACLPVGINILRNASIEALAAASASGASFIRVNVLSGVTATDQGLIEGKGAELLRARRNLQSNVAICADLDVKYGVPLYKASIQDLARSTYERGGADALIVSGKATGAPTNLDEVEQVRSSLPEAPLLIGSGVTPATIHESLTLADGVIIGSYCRQGGKTEGALDPERLAALVAAAAPGR